MSYLYSKSYWNPALTNVKRNEVAIVALCYRLSECRTPKLDFKVKVKRKVKRKIPETIQLTVALKPKIMVFNLRSYPTKIGSNTSGT